MVLRENLAAGFLTLLILAAIANLGLAFVGLFLGGPYSIADNTAPYNSFHKLDFGHGDYVYNWDFTGEDTSSTNVDWGMRFIFKGNASINTVKDKLDGQKNDPGITPEFGSMSLGKRVDIASSKDAYVDDGPEREKVINRIRNQVLYTSKWDSDRGIKDAIDCDWNWGHMRLYANSDKDKNYNATYKFYVVASIHRDYEWNNCRMKFTGLESDEDKWIKRIKDNLVNTTYNWTIQEENFNWKNSAAKGYIGVGTSHQYHSDGMGSTVTIPDDD